MGLNADVRRALRAGTRAFLAAMALSINLGATQLREIVGVDGLPGAFAVLGLYALLRFMDLRAPEKRPHWTSVVCAALFSGIVVVGKAFKAADSLRPIYGSLPSAFASALAFAGIFLLLLRVLDFLYTSMSSPARAARGQGLFARIFPDDARLARIALILLVCWLPYLIFNFPGGPSGDMPDQIAQFFGHETRTSGLSTVIDAHVTLNTMNPVLHTVLMGALCTLFRRGGDLTYGIFAFCMLQAILSALVYARTIVGLGRLGAPRWARVFALAFYALNPIIPMFAYSTAKDQPFAILMLLICTLLAEAFTDPKRYLRMPRLIELGVLTLLFILFRNSAIYVACAVAVAGFCAVGARLGRRVALSAALLVPILASFVVTGVVYPALSIRKSTSREDKSFLFQASARFALQYPDEVTAEERAVISAVLDYDHFAENYTSGQADGIKRTFKESATDAQMDAYYGVWRAQLKRHPLTFIESAISMGYAYFNPDMRMTDYWLMYYRAKTLYGTRDGATYAVYHPKALQGISDLMAQGVTFLGILPGTGVFLNIGMYTWALIAIAFFALRARSRAGLLLLPYFALTLGLALTPLNGSMRYALGSIVALPLYIAIGLCALRRGEIAQ